MVNHYFKAIKNDLILDKVVFLYSIKNFYLDPKIAVPIRTIVAPQEIAIL